MARPLDPPPELMDVVSRLRPANPVILESSGGPSAVSRFSIVGLPSAELDLPVASPTIPGDPVSVQLEEVLGTIPGAKGIPPPAPWEDLPFMGGWIGYFAFELGRAFEHLPSRIPPSDCPPVRLLEIPAAIVHDRRRRAAVLVVAPPPAPNAREAYARGLAELDALQALCLNRATEPSTAFTPLGPLRSTHSKEDYCRMVDDARAFIHAGDIFQVNLSQRFQARVKGDPFELYRTLRRASPAPFSAYLDFGDVQIVGSSPERFLLLDGDVIETRPIKGTYPRGVDPREDNALADALRIDPKECAEHVMIVDLERNDLGRLAARDSVEVRGLLRVERYPQVLHLVSTVRARLSRPLSLWELLRQTFPGGSITGAPKIRALEIIDALERCPRGIYTGALGYISFSGRIDLNIAIRTIIVRGGRLDLQVGGGIVAASDPAREYEETRLKAKGMCLALGLTPP